MNAASTPASAAAPASTPGGSAMTAGSAASAAPAPTSAPAAPTARASAAAAAPRPAASSPVTVASAAPSTPSAPAAAAPAASATAGVCLEAGPLAPAEVAAAEAALRPVLAAGGWSQRRAQGGGEWMIYMGPYPDREFLERKKSELSRIRGGVPQDEVTSPPELARGLSLGRFPSPTAANATLAQYRQRGIRTARVVQSSSGQPVVYLRVAQAEPGVASALGALKLPNAPRGFAACPR